MVINSAQAQKADSSSGLEIQKKRLRENCREFESVMLGYLMKTMREGVIRGEEPGHAMEMYEEMLAGEVSKEIGRSSALGVGDALYAKLEPMVKPGVIPPEDAASAP